MTDLYLVGESHFDLYGYGRLMRIFRFLRPFAIATEDTGTEFHEALQISKKLQQPKTLEIAIQNALKQFPKANHETLKLWLRSVHYSVQAISDYSTPNSIPVLYCDDPAVLTEVDFRGAWGNQPSSANAEMTRFLSLPPEAAKQDIQIEYEQEYYPISDLPELVEFYSKRDNFAEPLLRQQISRRRLQQGVLVYACGLDHLYGNYRPNLFDRLADLNPIRMKLSDADRLPAVQ